MLDDGSTASGDLVIGADGIHSLVCDTFNDPPDFKVAASAVIEGIADFDHPWLADGHRAQVWGHGRRCGVGALGGGRARWFLGGVVTPDEPEVDHAELIRRTEGLPDIVRGDAAHTLSPFAGMGACSTIEDAAQLVELIGSSTSVDEALAASTEKRKAKTRAIEKGGRRNEWMMMTTSPTLAHVRDWLFEHTPEDKLHKLAAEMATGE